MKHTNPFDALGLPADDATIEALRSDFAAILRSWIAREGLSQTAAGKKLGVPQSVLSNLVNGRTGKVSIEYMIRLLSKVHVPWTARCWYAPHDACAVEGKAPFEWIAFAAGTVESTAGTYDDAVVVSGLQVVPGVDNEVGVING